MYRKSLYTQPGYKQTRALIGYLLTEYHLISYIDIDIYLPFFQYTAISITVVGSKYNSVKQDLKILWIFYE